MLKIIISYPFTGLLVHSLKRYVVKNVKLRLKVIGENDELFSSSRLLKNVLEITTNGKMAERLQ